MVTVAKHSAYGLVATAAWSRFRSGLSFVVIELITLSAIVRGSIHRKCSAWPSAKEKSHPVIMPDGGQIHPQVAFGVEAEMPIVDAHFMLVEKDKRSGRRRSRDVSGF